MDYRRPASAAIALLACALLPLSGARGAADDDPYEKVRATFQQAYADVDDPTAKRRSDSEAL
ncbi:MAG TPA: hypothetical protein VFV69_05875, partial [Steroidobacteraceae bacterium]|nr:hypothetical protein [Steroidobacteraceae bacterium]